MSEDKNIRLLLVDDHPLVRDGLRARLEAVARFSVVGEADDETSALAAARQGLPDVAIVDIGLRGTTGIEVTRRLQAELPEVRIVILTMHNEPQVVLESFRAGARAYVLKDSPARDIVAAIDAVAAGRKYYSAGVADALADAAAAPPEPNITQREHEILALVGQGLSSKEIAARLQLSTRTVETHRLHIKRKLALDGSSALVRFALERKKKLV